jgi:predicted  nucleic acid-binding Zn-ribbon protein
VIQDLGFQIVNKPRVLAGVSTDRWHIETVRGEVFPANERELALWQKLSGVIDERSGLQKTAGEADATIRELRMKVASLEQQLEARRHQQGGKRQ